MNIIIEAMIAGFIVISGIFGLVGSYGMIKLPDTMRRLHAPTKATTLGIGGVLIGSMGYFYFAEGIFAPHELMITLFLFLTAPVTANFISKVYMLDSVPESNLPKTGSDYGWAGYDDPPDAETEKQDQT